MTTDTNRYDGQSPLTVFWVLLLSCASILALLYGPVRAAHAHADVGPRFGLAIAKLHEVPEAFRRGWFEQSWKPVGLESGFDRAAEADEPIFAFNEMSRRLYSYRAVAHNRAYALWLILFFGFTLQAASALVALLTRGWTGAQGGISGFLLGFGFFLSVYVGFDLWAAEGSWSALLASFHWWAWPIFLIAPGLAAWSTEA